MRVPAVKIAPSILSADFSALGEAVAAAERAGADMIHIDVMDGHFVPNLTVGPQTVRALRRHTKLPFDCHLMIENPDRYIGDFARAGADIITVHAEACTHLHRTVGAIREAGAKAGVALNPATPLAAAEFVAAESDMLLLMTVNPGFGGQKFIRSVMPKLEAARKALEGRGLVVDLEVDGGINAETAPIAVRAGANILVAGNALFNEKPIGENMRKLREAVHAATEPSP